MRGIVTAERGTDHRRETALAATREGSTGC